MIPSSQYDQARVDNLLWYLIQELERIFGDRKVLEASWERWERVYRARPSQSKKDFPFAGASNLVVPVAATDVDTLFSRMMGLLFEPGNLWSVSAQRPELIDFAVAMQDFMEWAQHNEIKPYSAVGNWLLQLHKLGTGVMKQRYVREMKKVFEWREMAGRTFQQQAVIMLKDHPQLDHVQLWDFFVPPGFNDLQKAPWCAERIRLTWSQFMNRVKAGLYTNADKVGAWFFNPPINAVQQHIDNLQHYRASVNDQLELYEFWLDYDIDADGWDEALVCTIHLDSWTYVRLDYNPFFNQEKPYSSGQFMRNENGFYGIGLCEMLDQFQEEITALHNQRIDNGTVCNSQMYAYRRNNLNIRKNEPNYPGRMIPMDDPKNDIVPIPLGAGMGSALAAAVESETTVRQEAQRRTGVNDYVQANASPSVGYGAAYTTQQMLLQSDKRFGETLRSVRDVLNESGLRLLELYQQFFQGGKPFIAVGNTAGRLVDVVLKFPVDLIRKGLKVTVTAIDAQTSKEAQIRTTTLVFQQLQQFYMNYMQLLSYAMNPQMPPQIKQVALTAAEGSSVLMRRLLDLYGQKDYDRMVPELQGAQGAQQFQLQQIQSVLQSGMGGGVQSPGSPTGVQGVPYDASGIPSPSPYFNAGNQLGPGGYLPSAGGTANAGTGQGNPQ